MTAPVFSRVLVGWDGSTGAQAAVQLGYLPAAGHGGRSRRSPVVPSYVQVEDPLRGPVRT